MTVSRPVQRGGRPGAGASADRFLCSVAADERDEPAFATASRIDRWLLVESPGPWGPRALPESRGLDDDMVLSLQQRAKAAHARLLLIRRPWMTAGSGRRVFAADSRPGHERLLTRLVDEPELAELTMPEAGPVDRMAPDGWESADAFVGVCTQGRHDVCCAIRGRPVAAALAISHPSVTWEVSHIGGDRFAANLLVLPGGHYLGQLPPEGAAAAVEMLLAGLRPSPYYRGRSCWPMPAQAALELAATRLDIIDLDALVPQSLHAMTGHRWEVILATRTGELVTVEVEQRQGPVSRLTCHALTEHPTPSWHLTSLTTNP